MCLPVAAVGRLVVPRQGVTDEKSILWSVLLSMAVWADHDS
jgi:hypothetical protein